MSCHSTMTPHARSLLIRAYSNADHTVRLQGGAGWTTLLDCNFVAAVRLDTMNLLVDDPDWRVVQLNEAGVAEAERILREETKR